MTTGERAGTNRRQERYERRDGTGRAPAICALALLLLAACGSSGDSADAPAPTPSPTPGFDRALGFVVSGFGFAYPDTGVPAISCPGGYNRGPVEYQVAGQPVPADDCEDPSGHEDPAFATMQAAGVVDGFDLDAGDAPRGCGHAEFTGLSGEPGVDDQLWRAIGCIRGFQRGDVVDGVVDGAVRDGSMTILVDVRDVDDPRNDDDVAVQIFASPESPPVGPDGSVLPWGTLGIDPDPRFHGTVGRGRIEDGVLVAGPMDLRVRLNIQIVAGELAFRNAFLRLAIGPDGAADGVLHGYLPVDGVYEIFGRQAGAIGGKEALGYLCSGLAAALAAQADGDLDRETGACTSISASYRIDVAPAFVAR